MKHSHTPGPWTWSMGYLLTADGTYCIADTERSQVRNKDEREANAHLIAAAPELLDALKLWAEAYESGELEKYEIAMNHSRAAIAKAKGTSL